MVRLFLIIGAIAVLAQQPLDADAQDKKKAKLKLCADGTGSSMPSRERCVETKGINAPLQIGGSSFGSSGSAFKGGASGTSIRPGPQESPFNSRATMGGGLRK